MLHCCYGLIYFVIEIDLIISVTLHVVHLELNNACDLSKLIYRVCICTIIILKPPWTIIIVSLNVGVLL